jgi:hypothetical protein
VHPLRDSITGQTPRVYIMYTSFKAAVLSLVAAWSAQAKSLRINGVAILTFGVASTTASAAPSGTVRRLRAPIRGLLSADQVRAVMERQLELEADAATAAEATESDRQVALYGARSLQDAGGAAAAAASTGQQPLDLEGPLASTGTLAAGGTVTGKSYAVYVFGIIAAVISVLAGFALYIFCVKRRDRQKSVETRTEVVTSSSSSSPQQEQPQQEIAFTGHYGSSQIVN